MVPTKSDESIEIYHYNVRETIEVHEDTEQYTGLLDKGGNPIFRMKDPIGFKW